MIRLFAKRPFLFVALAMCLGIFLMVRCLENSTIWLYILILLLIYVLVALSFLLYSLKTSNKALKFIATNRLIWLFCLAFYALGGVLSLNKIENFTQDISGENYYICGIVDSTDNYYSREIVILENVYIKTEKGQEKLKGKVELSVYSGQDSLLEVEIGNKVSFVGSLLPIEAISSGQLNYYDIKENIRYNSTLSDITSFKVEEKGSLAINDKIRFGILDDLLKEMPESLAYLSFSILFGDSSYLSDFTDKSFKISGVSHIVAVSGMNVVIIVTILMFLLRFIKCKKLIKFIFITLVLIGYCYLCDFTPSVVRATIMALVVLSGSFLGRQNDILSSLGLSCIIISIIWPLSLYDVGFLLSFASVIGIVLFCNGMNSFLNEKCKIPNWLSSAIAVTVSAQIGIYPIMASYFNAFSLYSIPANIVVVPIFSLAYILLFSATVITMILPFMSFILVVPAVVMSFVNWFPSIFVDLPYATLYVFDMSIFSFFYYIALLFISSFVFIKNKVKIPISIGLVIAMATAFVAQLLPQKYNKDSITTMQTYEMVNFLTTQNNEKILIGVGSAYDSNKIIKMLQENRIFCLDAVILMDSNADAYKERSNIENINSVCKIKKLIIKNDKKQAFETSAIPSSNILTIEESDFIKLNGVTFYFLYDNDNVIGIICDTETEDTAIILDINKNQALKLSNELSPNLNVICYDEKDAEYFKKQ